MDPPVLHELVVDGPQTEEDARVATVIADTPLTYPGVTDNWDEVQEDEASDNYFEGLYYLMINRYIKVAEFFIEEMNKKSLSVVNADKLANHLNEIRKTIKTINTQYDVRPLSDVDLNAKFEDVVSRVVPLIKQATAAAKGGSRNKSRSRKHKKSRNHKKSRKHKKSSKKSKRL